MPPKPLRWGKTMGAYLKYAYIFENELPCTIAISSLSQVGYLRDVITYAHENDLKGALWHGKVKLQAVEGPAVYIYNKANETATLDVNPTKNVFDIMELKQNGKLEPGLLCHIAGGVSSLEDIAGPMDITYEVVKDNLVKFT